MYMEAIQELSSGVVKPASSSFGSDGDVQAVTVPAVAAVRVAGVSKLGEG